MLQYYTFQTRHLCLCYLQRTFQNIEELYGCLIVKQPADVEEDNLKGSVMALNCINSCKSIFRFTMNKEDISFVIVDDILGMLLEPEITNTGCTMQYNTPTNKLVTQEYHDDFNTIIMYILFQFF